MDDYEKLLERVKKLPPMTAHQKRAQAICWAVGNVMLQRKYADLAPEVFEEREWEFRLYAAKAYDLHRELPPF